ncbi:hypothetical protein H0E87_020851 [Populus deltoides]|uniref:Uncharacterized protein n=1 Tax=Populus deltoides TaxID=3696 RepID=A0A8T2XQ28_POPDE|nr:hypothetical protein H0E87_020851 [Populus deltoides]
MFHSFYANDGPATAVVKGSSHSTVISCSTDCTCKLRSLLDGTNLCRITFPCTISGIALDPTETEFYASGADGLIYKGFLKAGGNNMKSRSDLVVASGIGDGKRQGVRADDDMNKSVGSGTGLSGIRVYQISKGYS